MQLILRLPQVVATTGVPRSSVYERVKAGTFPAPVKIGKRAIGWRTADITAWLDSLKSAGAGVTP
jgi:prophage regulatory protein